MPLGQERGDKSHSRNWQALHFARLRLGGADFRRAGPASAPESTVQWCSHHSTSMITFAHPLRIPFQNALTGTPYFLVSGDQIEPTPARLLEIARCANEPLVYDLLFRQRFEGEPYRETDAADWITWTHAGWRANTHFSFMVQDEAGRVVAACDIKSNDVEGAEVGYWASAHHRGVMTNAVKLMCREAAKAGFRSLTARTKWGNARSKAVLHRVGFEDVPSHEDERYEHYLLCFDDRSWITALPTQ